MPVVAIETKSDPFDQFWAKYPRKVCKKAARQAFEKALRIADFDKIMGGLESYICNKPHYADWCHASTWLNNERWEDEYESHDHGDRIAELIHGHR